MLLMMIQHRVQCSLYPVNKSQVSKNQKPRAQEPEAKCADFEVFLNLSVAIPHYFLLMASAFRPIRPFCMVTDDSWMCEKKTNINFYFLD